MRRFRAATPGARRSGFSLRLCQNHNATAGYNPNRYCPAESVLLPSIGISFSSRKRFLCGMLPHCSQQEGENGGIHMEHGRDYSHATRFARRYATPHR
ncbi:hypothetical protein KCP71_16185 [Salmonella enterica subsp. enterica]|nr:hypothetical protein KCP71_16185 [Salmonella enterica subsp. enterica]